MSPKKRLLNYTVFIVSVFAVMCFPAFAFVTDLLTGDFAQYMARGVFGVLAVGSGLMVLNDLKNTDTYPIGKIILVLVAGSLALKWNTIVGGISTFFS
jgi:hypothetical protein